MIDLKQLATEALRLSENAAAGPWYESGNGVYTDAEGCKLDLVVHCNGTFGKPSRPFIAFSREALPALAKGYLGLCHSYNLVLESRAKAEDDSDAAYAKLAKAVEALKTMLASAHPHPIEHKGMTAAWAKGNACLKELGEELPS